MFHQYRGGMTAVPGRTIAIGDMHGCSAALAALVDAINPGPDDLLVALGDYIDRGPDSRGVLDQLLALSERCVLVPLLGNHEEMLLAAMEGQSELTFWLKFGGMAALASYGYSGGRGILPGYLRTLIPSEHLCFIKGCRDYFETVGNIFVHAFYEPNRPLHEQPRGRAAVDLFTAHPGTPLLGQGGYRGAYASEKR
jgi:serine/threonine protein phosphatase 1